MILFCFVLFCCGGGGVCLALPMACGILVPQSRTKSVPPVVKAQSLNHWLVVIQLLQSCLTLCSPMGCSMPGFPVLHYLPQFADTQVQWIGDAINHLILCCPLLLLPSIFPSIRIFFNESTHLRWPKYWSFSFSISPSNEYSGLISLRIDWFDLLVVQGTLKVFSNTTAPKHQFFDTQPSLWSLSHILAWLLQKVRSFDYIQTFVRKVMPLLFNNAVYVCHSFPSKE